MRLEASAACATDFDPRSSDADSLVEFGRVRGEASLEQYSDIAEALRQTRGRPVDLVGSGAAANPHLRAATERSRGLAA